MHRLVEPVDVAPAAPSLAAWNGALRAGGWAGIFSVALIPVQIVGFFFWPPPKTAEAAFAQFAENRAFGLLSVDLLYLLNNSVILPFYLAFTVVLWKARRAAVANGMLLAAVGMAVLLASNRCFELMTLAGLYEAAADPAQRTALLAAGEAMLATWTGTGFVVYYLLNAVALLFFAWAMLEPESVFGRTTAWWGLAAGALMAVPSVFGDIGLVFGMASLIPWTVFAIRSGRRLIRLGRAS